MIAKTINFFFPFFRTLRCFFSTTGASLVSQKKKLLSCLCRKLKSPMDGFSSLKNQIKGWFLSPAESLQKKPLAIAEGLPFL